MDLKVYERFVLVVESGTLKAAAEAIPMDASTLGKQMHQLEEEYGPLFTTLRRGRQSLELTASGERVYHAAKHLLQQMSSLKAETKILKYGFEQTLKLVVTPSFSQEIYTQYLVHIASSFKYASFQVLETGIKQQEKAILQEQAELGFSNSSLEHPWLFDILSMSSMGYCLFCRKDNKYLDVTAPSYTITDLVNVPLCLSSNSAVRLYTAFDDAKVQPQVVSLSSMRQTTLCAAKLGLGVAIYPANAPLEDDDLVTIPLLAPGLAAEQIVYKSKGHELSPMAKALVALYNASHNEAHLKGAK